MAPAQPKHGAEKKAPNAAYALRAIHRNQPRHEQALCGAATRQASRHRDQLITAFVCATFSYPDFTVGVGLANNVAHRTPADDSTTYSLGFCRKPSARGLTIQMDHRRSGIGN